MTRDNLMPQGDWVFDGQVAECFDDMLERSIPDLQGMREVTLAAAEAVYEGGYVLDLGCSLGAASKGFSRVVGIDNSDAMLSKYRSDNPSVIAVKHDLDHGLPGDLQEFDICFCVLTLQFIDPRMRLKLLSTIPAQYLILVEKVTPESRISERLYYEHKRDNGYSKEQIRAKAEALDGVLIPISAHANETMLTAAGWTSDCLWRRLNFVAWFCKRFGATT